MRVSYNYQQKRFNIYIKTFTVGIVEVGTYNSVESKYYLYMDV